MSQRKERLDLALVRRGLAETRERAQVLILGGAVRVDGQPATRPADAVLPTAAIALQDQGPRYVSRGALKLERALDEWHIDASGKVALDVGASTGGFTDLLLRRGAKRVYAVDVGYGQLHYRLRTDPRVVSMERTNIRHLAALPEPADLSVVDVSFISLTLALPAVFQLTRDEVVALIKPQFEAGKGQVGKGGVVRDPAVRREVLVRLRAWSMDQPWTVLDIIASPVRGPAGNVEYLSRWMPRASTQAEPDVTLDRIARALSEGPQ